MNSFNNLSNIDWLTRYYSEFDYTEEDRESSADIHPLTLSPQLLHLDTNAKSGQSSQTQALKQPSSSSSPPPPSYYYNDQFRRASIASNISTSPSTSPSTSRTSSSTTTTTSRASTSPPPPRTTRTTTNTTSIPSPSSRQEQFEKIHNMSSAPFCSSFSGIFGLTTECLACGFRYDGVHDLAEHQRMVHGVADVIF
ncbi:hypothetical protein SMMN14_08878 [Sphaerulina musiva]